ncbi:MAG: 50S ribosomal protein L17 [Bacillota bacterium]
MAKRKLNRNSSHRKAMFRNMLTELFRNEEIKTTLAKAKDLRSEAEKMITAAGNNDLQSRRKVLSVIQDKQVVEKLCEEIAPRFIDRSGGYTKILKLYPRRGDGAEQALLRLVD